MAQQIDLSTHDVLDAACEQLQGVSLEVVTQVWHDIARTVSENLATRKATKLPSLGVVSLSQSNQPTFRPSSELVTQFKLKFNDSNHGAPDNIPASNINFSQAATYSNVSRELVEKVYSKITSTLGKKLLGGRSIILGFHKLMELTFQGGVIRAEFISATSGGKGGGSVQHAKASPRPFPEESLFGNNKNSAKDSKSKSNPAPAVDYQHARNPITGDHDPYFENALAPPPRAQNNVIFENQRRPSSASSTSSSRPSSAGSYVPDRGSSSRVQVSYSPRPNAAAATNTKDARQIAAKALTTSSSAKDIVTKLRSKIVARGGSNGIRTLSKLLMIMDDNGDHRLSRDEFKYGLRDYGIDLSPTELEESFHYFDRDKNGSIDITEFLVGLAGDMSPQRKALVRMAFDILDKDSSGVITVDEIIGVYDFSWSPDVKEGKCTLQQAARNFMKIWDRTEQDGLINVEEFEDYYKEISASIDDDDYFELMIRNAWRIPGGKGAAANTANLRVLVTHADGTQTVETVHNELGLRQGDIDGIKNRLNKQGINASEIGRFHGEDTGRGGKATGARPVLSDKSRPRDAWAASPVQGNAPGKAAAKPVAKSAVPVKPNHAQTSIFGSIDTEKIKEIKSVSKSNNSSFDPWGMLQQILYTPPSNIEVVAKKLQVSSFCPNIPKGAFLARVQALSGGNLERSEQSALWKLLDPSDYGSIGLDGFFNTLQARFGKDKSASSGSVFDRCRSKILERCGGAGGIKGLQRTLSIMDNNGDKRLTKEELKFGLKDYGIELNFREIDEIFTYFDKDRNGFIDFTEFLVGIRGDLNDRRQQMVMMAFSVLDTDHSGVVTLDEIASKYDVSQHPEVKTGKKSPNQALRDFMKVWDRSEDGLVTYEEFEDYYKEISASIDGDDYFELMIRNAWRIPGGKGAAANTANLRVLVTHADGTQTVETVHNELGLRQGDIDGIKNRLNKQGINASEIGRFHGEDTGRGGKATGARPVLSDKNIRSSSANNAVGGSSMSPAASVAARNAFNRNMAAVKLAAVFRGNQARKEVAMERKKIEAVERTKYEEDVEANRPKPKIQTRPVVIKKRPNARR